jgi:ACR3 family arsenite transporter
MALLGWLFVGWLFRPWLPSGQIESYIAGLIILAAAPCTAMVFVWSNLTDGDPNFTLSQVALNAILLLAVPIVIQVYLNAGIAYWLNRALGVPHNVACPSALIGASNFFELAVAAAIALFGFQSGAALATVVGVLVEVPVMLSVVWIVLRSRPWYQAG